MNQNYSTPIENTQFGEFFESTFHETVFLIERSHAIREWEDRIDIKSTSFFNLPDSCWVISSKQEKIGNWILDNIERDHDQTSKIIKNAFDWEKNEKVLFCASKFIIIETELEIFADHWIDFLSIDNDAPLLVRKDTNNNQALLFIPVGDIIRIGR